MARTRRTVFILISGKAGVGKSTLASYIAKMLADKTEGITVMMTAFANPIKQLAANYFGWDKVKDEKGRRLLQSIGTECGRMYDENIWVKKTLNYVYDSSVFPPNFVIIDDWRFPNECTYILDQKIHDVVAIRVEAKNREILKGTPEENHPSEVSLPVVNIGWTETNIYDFVVDNTKDFEQLYRQGDEVIDFLEEKFILE